MKSTWLCASLAFGMLACGTTITNETDIAAPQPYRPSGQDKQWEITGNMESEVHRDDFSGAVTFAKRNLVVRINGAVAIQSQVALDAEGNTTQSLNGTFQDRKVTADCSSQTKTDDWIEVRCRILVDNEHGATLVF